MGPESASFQSQRAPCGRIVDGESNCDRDEEGLITNDSYYECGCRTIRHEYHDGTVSHRVVHHDGRVLVDEMITEHSA